MNARDAVIRRDSAADVGEQEDEEKKEKKNSQPPKIQLRQITLIKFPLDFQSRANRPKDKKCLTHSAFTQHTEFPSMYHIEM